MSTVDGDGGWDITLIFDDGWGRSGCGVHPGGWYGVSACLEVGVIQRIVVKGVPSTFGDCYFVGLDSRKRFIPAVVNDRNHIRFFRLISFKLSSLFLFNNIFL